MAAGTVAKKILSELGISLVTYTRSIGNVEIDYDQFDEAFIPSNPFSMPDSQAAEKAAKLILEAKENEDSLGGVVECVVKGMPAGVGDPVF